MPKGHFSKSWGLRVSISFSRLASPSPSPSPLLPSVLPSPQFLHRQKAKNASNGRKTQRKRLLHRLQEAQSMNLILQTDNIDRMTALGLRPDQSKIFHTVNLCCLLTRDYIWICELKESLPNMNNFLFFVKCQYILDAKNKAVKKWESLAEYVQSIN